MGPILDARQQETFRARGLIRLESFLDAQRVTQARKVVLRHLQRRGLWRDGDWQLEQCPPSAVSKPPTSLHRALKRRKELAELIGEAVRQAVVELLGDRSVLPMTDHPHILFTLPNAARWTVPHSVWHLDLPRLPGCEIPGVQLFTFLETVAPGGGGTLAVEGSHRLLNENRRISSKQVKKRLKREPYFRDLMSKHVADRHRFLHEPGRVGDVALQVVELHGRPGDAYLMDMRVLHTLAPNALRVPRIMLTQRFLRESLAGTVYGEVDAGDPDRA